jgi:hypothetical protein
MQHATEQKWLCDTKIPVVAQKRVWSLLTPLNFEIHSVSSSIKTCYYWKRKFYKADVFDVKELEPPLEI